jgi:thiol-disulfide isomerase/thioredoxin
MTSRRMLLGAGGAAIAAGIAGVFAIKRTSRRPVRNRDEAAPDFSVSGIDGPAHYRLADFAGKVLLLNFWATWCAPCRVEMPWLARTYARYHPQGLTILGVNMDDGDMPAAERFARQMGVTYPIARNNDAAIAAYGGVRFLPQSFLVGQHGELLQRTFGMPSTGELEAAIMSALARR